MPWTRSGISSKNKLRLCGIGSLILVCMSGHFLFFHQISKTSIHQKIYKRDVNVVRFHDADRKIVLAFWTGFWTEDLNEAAKYCPKCLFTENISYFNVSDAVVFHARKARPQSTTRPKNQIWVWYYLEPPNPIGTRKLRKWSEPYLKIFNWTMHYRKDSDILLPYGSVFPFERPSSFSSPEVKWSYIVSEENKNNGVYNRSLMPVPTIEELRGRKMVSWIVSNCRMSSGRHLIAKELSKYVKVNIYGRCGIYKCPRRRPHLYHGIDCRVSIAPKYKFYLAFENSICEDYVTEKFFLTLRTQMVPIVYDGANYSAIAPNKSYINVMDFKSIKDLADYLIYLDKNPAEYLKYFEWRKHYWVEQYRPVIQFCTLCDKLWSIAGNVGESKSYTDIVKWWTYRSDHQDPLSPKNACVSPRRLQIFPNISDVRKKG